MMSAAPRSEVSWSQCDDESCPRNNCGFNSPLFLREFLFDQPLQIRRYRRFIETLDHFVQKPRDDEPLGDGNGNAASAKIKKFVRIDLTGSCAVGATDVVCENFKPRH